MAAVAAPFFFGLSSIRRTIGGKSLSHRGKVAREIRNECKKKKKKKIIITTAIP